MSTFFYWVFLLYIVPSFMCLICCITDDILEDTNSFEQLWMSFIPVFNILACIVYPFLLFDAYRIVNYIIKSLYVSYALMIGKRNEEFEKKHNITWMHYDR